MRSFLTPFALAILLTSPPAVAQSRTAPPAFAAMPGIAFRYYDVSGRTGQEVAASLRRNALRRPDGQSASGLTRWGYSFRWGEYSDRHGCRIRDPRNDVSITVTLPRLASADRLAPRDRAWWDDYRRTIERHEAGHARIALDHAGDFARAAEGARCGEIKTIAARVMERAGRLQADYDRVTRHGQAQEAVD